MTADASGPPIDQPVPRSDHPLPRPRLIGGAVGPIVFVSAWVVLGWATPGYSPVDDPISRLAAIGAPTRWAMTGALLVYAAGLAAYATEIGPLLGRGVARAAGVNAVATLAVAATPLDSPLGGTPHVVAAAVGYVSVAAMPLLAARSIARSGHRPAAAVSVGVTLVAGTCLLVTGLVADDVGLWQRIGLTVADAWLVASVVACCRGRRRRPRQHVLTESGDQPALRSSAVSSPAVSR